MCHYSMEVTKTRKARQGELLRFRRIGDSVGFMGRDHVVICLRRGTEVDFTRPIRTSCGSQDQPSATTATFGFLRANRTSNRTYDKFDFADGKQIMLIWLKPGQFARVVQLPAKRVRRAKVRQPESMDA